MKKPSSFDALIGRFLRWTAKVESADQLRAMGVSDEHVDLIEKLMLREGLDPKRPDDVQVMLDRLVKTTTDLPSARLQ